ncbi:hypothetical protein O3P69_014468 [Scylla paramamosain]|uniref:Solute carrier family 23 member 1 n=2 Tax=Scylla paramamosain TaxID=85552 RepID=A0AAW0TBH5_SCYPA
MCMEPNDPYRGDIVSTIIFVSGIITILQVTFGIRLPIIQGANFAYVAPAITIITYSFPACDSLDLSTMTADEKREQWQIRMRELQGAIVVSSVFQVLLGLSGAVGVLMRFVTPLTVVPTVTTLGLSLFSVATAQASSHWGISGLTVVLLVFISQYLKNVQVPYPFYSRGRGFHVNRAPIFTYFPLLLVICITWGVCGILTKLNLLPEESKARTDVTSDLLRDSSWFRIPYPGQWGVPSLSVGGVMGMTAAVFASVVESIGDYQACARVSERLTPPAHAVNRAVACEGLGCVLAGLYGTASGTASYTGNIILIGITRVPSRRVIQVSGLVMLLTGMCGKLCAVFASIPLPVLGGCLMFMFSLVTGIGLAPLQLICLRSPRNLFVLGFSLFIALAVPDWLEKNPGAVQTGYQMIDQGLTSLLQTSLFVGGLSGMILDNTIPGTIEERGLTNWQYFQQSRKSSTSEPADICYDLPFGMTHIERWNWTKYVPFLPTFGGFRRKE